MMGGDTLAGVGYFALALVTLALAETLHRRGVARSLTRKLVHVTAGLSPLFVTLAADTKAVGVGLYVLTVAMNWLLWRRQPLRAIGDGSGSPGIVYFPIAQTALLAWLWQPNDAGPRWAIAMAALGTLALGDAAAALVGERVGRHPYTIFGSRRTLEGSAAMFGLSFAAIAAALSLGPASLAAALPRAALAAALATLVEAVSPRGLDNLTVPLSVALLLVAV